MKVYRKMAVMFVFMVFIFAFLVVRLMKLSTDSSIMTAAANSQSTYSLHVADMRGNIYDRKMHRLVNNDVNYIAAVNPVLRALSQLKGNVNNSQTDTLESHLKSGKPLCVSLDMPIQSDDIISFTAYRRYSKNQPAAHIIGYTNGDGTGVYGIEKVFNNQLTTDASIDVSYRITALGTPFSGIAPYVSDTSEHMRQGVILTLDSDIQAIAEDAADMYIKSGAIVIMKADSGDILACVSRPTFDPDNIALYIDDDSLPLFNRAFSAYNVGSIFKLVTAAAAIEDGIDTDLTYDCTGSITVGTNTFNCHNHAGHGIIDMTTATAKSCNPYYINLGQQIGGGKIYDMAVNLGFGKPIYFAENYSASAGTLPDKALLEGSAVTANFSFGQGELTATPIQMCSLINTVASYGQYYKPQLIKGTVDSDGSIMAYAQNNAVSVFSISTAAKLQNMMQTVLSDSGTGMTAQPYNTTAGGKTATAQTGMIKDGKSVEQSWFGGFFPFEQPEYSVIILSENTSDGKNTSCLAFKHIAEQITELDNNKQ